MFSLMLGGMSIVPGIFILFVIVAVVAIIVSAGAAKKRREAMQALAATLGLDFYPEKDHDLPKRVKYLNALRQGSNRYAHNTMAGTYRDHDVTVFDYHYQTQSSNGNTTQTQHHHLSFFILALPRAFPEVKIGPESFFSKIAQAVGYDDIDFESHEFSRAFCVRSRDKKLAYDVCNAQMIEYLLANRDLTIEIEEQALAIGFNKRLTPPLIQRNLDRLIKLRSLLPDYLFDNPGPKLRV
jgi:hypothetical protein